MASINEGKCFICERDLVDGNELSNVKLRGLRSLLESSIKRQELNHERYIRGVLDGSGEVIVHLACRKSYTSVGNIRAAVRSAGAPISSRPTRSIIAGFDYNNACFLCDEAITQDFRDRQAKLPVARRNDVVKVMAEEKMSQSIIETARKRNDGWGKKIEERISSLKYYKTDLVAVNAEYHRNCMRNFHRVRSTGSNAAGCKRGRPRDSNVEKAMEFIYTSLENNSDECQFSLSSLLEEIDINERPDTRTVKNRLKQKYGDDIIISESEYKGPIISFKKTGHKILQDSWYTTEKMADPQKERLRVVEAAAEIILEDIRSKVFNTSSYPTSDTFFSESQEAIPETLLHLIRVLILSNKRGSLDNWQRKCLSLAHAIMLAVRPRSFLSPIMIGIAVYIYKKFGSKHLIQILSSLGFSASYKEASRLEGSYVLQAAKPKIDDSSDAFIQFIFDNADFNVHTLDGNNTFHAMGGIIAVTPLKSVTCETEIARMEVSSASKLIAAVSSVPVIPYHRPTNSGLQNVKVENIQIDCSRVIDPSHSEITWLYGKNSAHSCVVPGWNGFMEQGTTGEAFERSKVVCLPFINAPPSDYNTLFTSILAAMEECKSLNQKTCILTFDQPLFWKARDIVASVPDLRNVIIRLGGFHLLMSYMGAVGTVMAGSGLKDLFSTIYASHSVEKILLGHAYARAIRAHFLVHAALAGLVFEQLSLTEEEISALNRLIQFTEGSSIMRAHEDTAIHAVTVKFREQLKTIERKGPTATLWIQYFRMCTLLKDFIKAERMGDWELHLECVKEMIPFFHAAGHFNYAKSAHLYYQDMVNLSEKMEYQEFQKFTKQGYFTIRRSDKFWSGIWSDMTIEQVLMRAMKSYGGLTRGRGVSESVLSRWTVGMLYLHQICEQVETFADVSSGTSEQHVDMRPSRITRDNVDIGKLKQWLFDHPPFLENKEIVSLGTGQIGDGDVNCHRAREIGATCMKNIVGQPFDAVKLKRKDKVTTLASLSCSIKIAAKKFTVDPLTLFQRVCLAKKSDDDLKELFTYELSPYPMSLFTEEGMRKGTKSSLYEAAFNSIEGETDFGSRKYYVIDGGFLLHKVTWSKTSLTFHAVCQTYVEYVLKWFGSNSTIVFDGYPDDLNFQSTKSAERSRRSVLHSSSRFTFTKATPVTVTQESFLSNYLNKSSFIKMLMEELTANGIEVSQAIEDADTMIVHTAIKKAAEYDSVVITGEDVDLLVILTGLCSIPGMPKNVFFNKCSRGKGKSLLYSATSCKVNPRDIMFLHAISGCDTTSSFFGQGKKKVIKFYSQSPFISEVAAVFLDPIATQIHVAEAAEKFTVGLYGGVIESDSLDELRFMVFQKSVTKPKFHLARLPPTKEVVSYHAFRTYLQVQTWLGNNRVPTEWGWERSSRGLEPIRSMRNAAPDHILTVIACKCTKGCSTAACSCKKAGLLCSTLCKSCVGSACENSPEPNLEDEYSDLDDNGEWIIDSPEEERQEDSPSRAKRTRL